jgi:hypothetical protein
MDLNSMNKLVFEKIHEIVLNHRILLTENDILEFLKIRNRWPYQYYHEIDDIHKVLSHRCPVQCIGYNDVPICDEFYDKRGRFIFDSWKKFYDLGFTTMISEVLDLTEELRDLEKKIREIIGINFGANFYFSKGQISNTPSSWNHHNHSYDVVVKSIYGKSIWKIGEDVVELENTSVGIFSGTYHSVISCPEKRLSLTINL